MANVFVVIDCKKRKPILATPSARKAKSALKSVKSGLRVEIWYNDTIVATVYSKEWNKLDPYIELERQYIGRKQKQAEKRNKRRRS